MITVKGLVKRYQGENRSNAVDHIDFVIPDGQLFTLLGPSGCGKSTTLRMIAGLEEPTAGEIILGDQIVYSKEKGINIPTNKRPIGMVFQSYAIWPHMTVFENVSFPLKIQKVKKQELEERTHKMLEVVGLGHLAHRPATALSGGQQQRVALARALVREPKVLLLDEPLSNLDAKLREQMRDEIRVIQQKIGITAIYVTHDQSEALAISDLVMLMKDGKIMEFGPPVDIYHHPRSAYGAQFVGVSNRLDGKVQQAGDGRCQISVGDRTIECGCKPEIRAGDMVNAFIRPENISMHQGYSGAASWNGIVKQTVFLGDVWEYTVAVDNHSLRIRSYNKEVIFQMNEPVHLTWKPDAWVVIPERS